MTASRGGSNRRSLAALSSLALAGLLLGPASQARADTFTVTKTQDTADGACNADCSLREAVIAANASSGPDTIVVPAGTYRLTRTGSPENEGLTGDLDLIGVQVTVRGAGTGATVIDAGGIAGLGERVFHVGAFDTADIPTATIMDLTITGGYQTGSEAVGGGILADNGVVLTLSRVSLDDNYAGQSGAGLQAEPDSQVTISDSTIEENETTFLGVGVGLLVDGGTLVIDRTLVHGNHAMDSGGGIYVFGSGKLTLRDSTLSENTALGGGGGLVHNGTGGALLSNVTISGNRANGSGGGIQSFQPITINNVTVTGNRANADDSGSFDEGGGVVEEGSTFTARNSIIANNIIGTGGTNPDCAEDSPFLSQGHNLIEQPGECPVTGPGDITGQDPNLGPLLDNGGATATHALLPGSPAIDAGDPSAPGSGGTACEATDQRGVPRNCDIGAYELVSCLGVAVNRLGTGGDDTLTGTEGPDGFLAGAGQDEVSALGGDDALCLEDGNDSATGGAGNDLILGDLGNDEADGGDGDDRFVGGAGNDVGRGAAGNDLLQGEAGRDRLRGAGGRDRLVGQGGKDSLAGGGGRDRLSCGAGKDTGKGGPGNDTARGCEKGKP